MNNKHFIFIFFIIILLLIILILCYRNYVYNYCKNDMKCLKEKLLFNLNNMDNKLKTKYNEIKTEIENSEKEELKEEYIQEEQVIEGFFNGITDWFSGSSPSNVPLLPGTLPDESLSTLEKKINDKIIPSSKPFLTEELNGNIDDFKDSDNAEILNSIKPNKENNKPEAIFDKKKIEIPKEISKPKVVMKEAPKVIKNIDTKSLLGSCQFFNDKCPENYHKLGNFSIEGISSNSILSCGDVQNTRPAKAVAQIKNNSIYEIHITDSGHGFNPSSIPKVTIEGGKGHGATAEAVIDDDGFLKIIKVINPGYNYSETPNIIIDAPFMNSSCHLCCKNASLI